MVVLNPAERMARSEIYALIQEIVKQVNPLTPFPFEASADTHRETYDYQFTAAGQRFAISMVYIGLFTQYGMEMTWDGDTCRLVIQYPYTTFGLLVDQGSQYPELYDSIQTLVAYFLNHPELC